MINMESAPSNLHHHHQQQHQLQQQLLVIGSSSSSSSYSSSSSSSSSTSSLVTPSWYEAATNHTWSTPLNENSGNYNHNNNNINEDDHHIIVCNNTTTTRNNNNSSRQEMIQDLGSSFHWPSSNNNAVGSIYFPNKFTEMMLNSSSSCSSIEDLKANNNNNNGDLLTHEKLLLNTTASASASSGFVHNNNSSGFGGRGSFSQIFPSINISDLTRQSSSSTSSAISSSCFQDMNSQALDLLTSARFSNQQQSSLHDPNFDALFKESVSFNPHQQQQHQMHQVLHRPPCGNPTYKISSPSFINGVAQQTAVKRPSSTIMEPKQSTSPAVAAAPKKSRLESRTCPPFKVRKEKLGDRIAALQQLVAPFGKTDTASVLMEAIGYIKFLQNQVETLSVPYMKSSRNNNNTHRTTHSGQIEDDGNEETKRDLRSRGLCLVPLSCMSYVTSDSGGNVGIGVGGIWPPSDYLGGT